MSRLQECLPESHAMQLQWSSLLSSSICTEEGAALHLAVDLKLSVRSTDDFRNQRFCGADYSRAGKRNAAGATTA